MIAQFDTPQVDQEIRSASQEQKLDPRLRFRWHYALILLVSGVVFFVNLGATRLWDRDEPRNAGCAAEMLARNDWVVPVFNGQLRTAKPALLYWLIMAAYSVCGVNEFAARLPSALLAVGTVLATYHIGRRLFNPAAALWGALSLTTSLLFGVTARAATPDSTLIFFSTLGLAAFVLGVFPNASASAGEGQSTSEGIWNFFRRPIPWRISLVIFAALGLAVLAKGPVGVVLPVAVMASFLMLARLPERISVAPRESWLGRVGQAAQVALRPLSPANLCGAGWQMRPLAAVTIVLAVALPWYLWVALRTDGEWLQGFLWNENVRRVMKPMEDHDGSLLYYPLVMLVGFFPWSVLALPVLLETVARLRRSAAVTPGYLFCVCWIGAYVALFSLAQTKLPSYVAPCFPALALLFGVFVERWLARSLLVAAWWPQVALASLVVTSTALVVALPIAARRILGGEEWLGVVALVPLLGASGALYLAWRDRREGAAVTFALTATALQVAFFGLLLVRVDRQQQCHVLFTAVSEETAEPRLASFGHLESSWVYYSGRPIEEFGELGIALPYAEPPSPGPESELRSPTIHEFANQPDAYIITSEKLWPKLRPQLPPEMHVLTAAPYFLRGQNLLLVGRKASQPPLDQVSSRPKSPR